MLAAVSLGICALCLTSAPAGAQATPIALSVDAREVSRGVVHARVTIPDAQGDVKLVYPKWLPGTHGATGPINNLVSIAVSSGGQRLTWRRDPVDLYAFYVTVPPGKSGLDVSYDYVHGSGRLSTPNMMSLSWNVVALTPFVEDNRTQIITPSITLPADWKYATALETTAQNGATVSFKPVSLEQLVDSPIDAGVNEKTIPLGSISGAPVNIAIFADTPEQLAVPGKRIGKLKNLVSEMGALYGARHFNHYTFLMTVSDFLGGSGLEHHQSSDDGSVGNTFIDEKSFVGAMGSLLGHEFNHSWDGKYRRPAGLATPNFQVPMQGELLWVYEGMTQFYGNLQTERSGIWSKQQWFDALALTYASLDTTTGRATRSLGDTAVSGPIVYGSAGAFRSMRRSADFYPESELMWLEADETILRLSGGKRSIDDFARAFFGRTNTGPIVFPYARKDVIDALNAVQPYDWAGFFATRVDNIAPHPPNPFEGAGYKLVYGPKPSAFAKIARGSAGINARYSLGISGDKDGVVTDVIDGSPAAKAGIGPGAKILGVNGQTFGERPQEQVDAALTAAQTGPPVRLLVSAGETYREVTLDYKGGPRYPRLERVAGTPDVLSTIAAPKVRPAP